MQRLLIILVFLLQTMLGPPAVAALMHDSALTHAAPAAVPLAEVSLHAPEKMSDRSMNTDASMDCCDTVGHCSGVALPEADLALAHVYAPQGIARLTRGRRAPGYSRLPYRPPSRLD